MQHRVHPEIARCCIDAKSWHGTHNSSKCPRLETIVKILEFAVHNASGIFAKDQTYYLSSSGHCGGATHPRSFGSCTFLCHETLFSLFTKGDWAWEHYVLQFINFFRRFATSPNRLASRRPRFGCERCVLSSVLPSRYRSCMLQECMYVAYGSWKDFH